jgi:hypothetical protein
VTFVPISYVALSGIESKLRITLVNPPYPQQAHHHPHFIPLGIGYLAAVLEKNGYKVDVIDCQLLKL